MPQSPSPGPETPRVRDFKLLEASVLPAGAPTWPPKTEARLTPRCEDSKRSGASGLATLGHGYL